MADLVTSLDIKQINGEYAKQEIGVETQNIIGLDKLLDITTEDKETSTHDYDEGDQFLWKGKLYEAVIPIGIGEAFIIDNDNANIKLANKVGDTFTGASADNKGSKGLVPAPNKGDQDKFLNARGFWSEVPGGTFLGTTEEWNELPQEEKNKYLKSKGGLVSLYNKGVYSYDGNELTPIAEKAELKNFQGISSNEKGEQGLVPAPEEGDGDKVLQGNGTWGKKLQMDIVMQDNEYGYINTEGTFVPFKSQSDIQAAVADAIKATKVGTAAAEDVLAGKTFTNSNGVGITGKMFNNGAVAPSGLNCGGTYTIPAGYHNGSGKVVANSLAAQTSADAGAGQILMNKTAWVSGRKITGSMANKGAWNATLNPSGSVTIPAGYHNGSGVVKANPNQNSAPYSFPVNDNGSKKDLGANNTYRYVDATNVYKSGAVHRASTATLLGTYNSASTIDIKSRFGNYKNYTTENFYYIISKVTSETTGGYAQTPPDWNHLYGCYGSASIDSASVTINPKLSYNATNGTLTISGLVGSASYSVRAHIDESTHVNQQNKDTSGTLKQTVYIDVYIIPT